MPFFWGLGFWGTVVFFLTLVGAIFACVGFGTGRLPLGITGSLLIATALYLLLTHKSDIPSRR
jgi:hypothetical protein